jgi:hypothetical protein
MGYNTDFFGEFQLNKPLTVEHCKVLVDFHDERHEDQTKFPSYWCQWIPNEGATAIVWDETEKFYNYVDWIKYLIEKYLSPWGYELNGEVEWHGDEYGDIGKIVVEHNVVKILEGEIIFKESGVAQ